MIIIKGIINELHIENFLDANFDINLSAGCSPLTVSITNNSLATGTEWYWYWDKDDNVTDAAAIASADSTVNFLSFTKSKRK